jgi:phosphate transport system permease protein
MSDSRQRYHRRSQLFDRLFKGLGLICTLLAFLVLCMLLGDILNKGLGRLSWEFLSNLPSRFPEKTGIKTALAGMVSLVLFTVIIAIPIGIAAGVYLEEYGVKNWLAKVLEINIANLAGVPSVIYGILGLEFFVRAARLGNSILAGALTLALLILPIIIVATREALRAVPYSLREGSYGMGATKWQTVYRVVIPSAFGGIMTGIILAISRAIGETAPLIVVGALVYVPFIPEGPLDQYTVLTIQIFNWTTRPQEGFVIAAAAGIIILLAFTLMLNGLAIWLRNRWAKKVKF